MRLRDAVVSGLVLLIAITATASYWAELGAHYGVETPSYVSSIAQDISELRSTAESIRERLTTQTPKSIVDVVGSIFNFLTVVLWQIGQIIITGSTTVLSSVFTTFADIFGVPAEIVGLLITIIAVVLVIRLVGGD